MASELRDLITASEAAVERCLLDVRPQTVITAIRAQNAVIEHLATRVERLTERVVGAGPQE